MLDSADLQRQIPILFREEKELTYADSMKHQKQFIRFLITKLHLVNAMTDDINREFVFDQDAMIFGFGVSEMPIESKDKK